MFFTKPFIFLLLTFAICLSSYGQEFPNLIGNNRVTTVAYYEMGETRTFHFENSKTKFKNDKKNPESESKVEYDVEITVLEQTDSAYIMEMVYKNFQFPDSKKSNEIENAFIELSEGIKIKYATDELGAFDSIINIEELSKEVSIQFDILVGLFKDKLKDESEILFFNSLMNHYKKEILKPENIDVLYSEDILKIHGYYGIEMILSKPIEIIIAYPALNNFVLEGSGTLTLNVINKITDSFTFSTSEHANKEALNAYLKSIFELFTMGLSNDKVNLSDFKYSSKSKSRFTMELSSGWVKIATHTITNSFTLKKDTVKSIEKTTIKAIKA